MYDNKYDLLAILKDSFNKVNNMLEYNNKTIQCYDIFSIIAQNKWIFDIAPGFQNAVFNKVVEMKINKDEDNNVRKIANIIGNNFIPIIFPKYNK